MATDQEFGIWGENTLGNKDRKGRARKIAHHT